MRTNIFINLIIIILLFSSCAKDKIKKSVIKEKSLELQVLEAYEEGMTSLEGEISICCKEI